jgi:hypothetical protein
VGNSVTGETYSYGIRVVFRACHICRVELWRSGSGDDELVREQVVDNKHDYQPCRETHIGESLCCELEDMIFPCDSSYGRACQVCDAFARQMVRTKYNQIREKNSEVVRRLRES